MSGTEGSERIEPVQLPSSSYIVIKACDNCRLRKVRCDRTSPCSNCRRAKVDCHTSPRVPRSKRSRGLMPSKYDDRINAIDTRLDRISHLMTKIVTQDSAYQPSPNEPNHPTHPPYRSERMSSSPSIGTPPLLDYRDQQDSPSPSKQETWAVMEDDGPAAICEGPSSFSAHSTQAIDFLNNVAGMDRLKGHVFDTKDLLDSLHHIVDAVKTKGLPSSSTPTVTGSLSTAAVAGQGLPPVQASVEVIQKAKDGHSVIVLFLNKLLHPQSLSDLCLKVYFSQSHSTAEYVILNVALFYLFGEVANTPANRSHGESPSNEYRSLCQNNLEAVLWNMPLHLVPSHEMALALCLATIYSIEVAKPSGAWVFATAAHRCTYSLGFHTRAKGAHELSDVPNQFGLLFWIIYFLEKHLSLRLGRCSTIADHDITVPLMGDGPAMSYCGGWVRLARLASQTYEGLYSALAFTYSDDVRRAKTLELSQELHAIQTESRDSMQTWLESGVNESQRDLLDFIRKSDEVLYLTMQTLIHRACLAPASSNTRLTEDCIQSARAALQLHESFVMAFNETRPVLLTTYIHWTILFSPFIPFMVVFCQALETGNTDDLNLMQSFVTSIESARHYSNAISKHYRLFQVFSNVAQRYTELKASSTPTPEHEVALRTQMGGCLSELGLLPNLYPNVAGSSQPVHGDQWHGIPDISSFQFPAGGFEAGAASETSSQLAHWHHANRLMMNWLDNNQTPP